MSRLTSYPLDTNFETGENVIGTDGQGRTSRFSQDSIVDATIDAINQPLNTGFLPVAGDGDLEDSLIESVYDSANTQTYSEVLGDNTTRISIDSNRVRVIINGAAYTPPLDPVSDIGRIVILRNGTTRIQGAIESVNTTDGFVLREAVSMADLTAFNTGDSALRTVEVYPADGADVVIEANTRIVGTLTATSGITATATFGTGPTDVAEFARGNSMDTIGTAARIPDLTASKITDFAATVEANPDVVANSAKVGITPAQTTSISTNSTNIALLQPAVTINSDKTSFPGFGRTATTALAGNTTIADLGTINANQITGLSVTAAPVTFTATDAATTQAMVEAEFYLFTPPNPYAQGQIAYLFYHSTVNSGALVETLLYVGPNQTTAAPAGEADWHDITTMLGTDIVRHSGPVAAGQLAIFEANGDVIGDSGITVDATDNSITATTFIGALQGNAATATTADSATTATTATSATSATSATTANVASRVDNIRTTAGTSANVQIWFGTQAEFDLITEVVDGSVLYIIR